ncbi:unnamed protein product [Gadus morhua 'NCC']
MAPFLGIIVTLCGLTGTHGITTVSEEVSVEVGATVSIPCLYEPSHKNLVKYLCKGMDWSSCSVEIETNSKSSSPEGLYTISDDPDQGVFTVTIKSQKEGTQTYWCAVEMGFWTPDAKTYFQLLGSKGKSSLYVDQQEITGFAGDSINIRFYSKTHGKPGWCELGHCKEPQDGFIEGSQYSIDARKQGVFVVTMKDLEMESSGWYIFFQGKLNMPIHLTVAVNPTTTNTGTHGITTVSEEVSVEVGATVSIPCLYEPSHKNLVKYLCNGWAWSSCSVEIKTNSKCSPPEGLYTISDDPDQGVFTVTIKSQKEGTQTYWCAVEMGFWTPDAKTYFQLLGSKGNSSLYVDQQEITGFAGDSINISFVSKIHGKPGWCKLGHCKEPQDGFIEGSQYSIDTSKQGVFVVTMKDLDMESSGWYIFFQGKLNMPIHLTVAVNSKTTNTTNSTMVSSLSEVVSDKKSTDVEPDNEPCNVASYSIDLKNLLMLLGKSLIIILVPLLIWWTFYRHAKSKHAAMTTSELH